MNEIRYRDAVTGEYVSEEYALANPDTTVRETERQAENDEAPPEADSAP